MSIPDGPGAFFTGIGDALYASVIEAGRWRFYLDGLVNTLIMAAIAAMVGVFIGLVLAVLKVSRQNLSPVKPKGLRGRAGRLFILLGGRFANLYTTVIRGTPVLVQLIILYFGVFGFAPREYSIFIAGFCFGVNSGAYVCEIIRAGIQSVDRGQTEAGRSLGLSSAATMRLIVLPQAAKNILPTIFNEFITLLKETSIAGYIALDDLTRSGEVIRSRVWTVTPLVVVGLIYLALVILLTWLQTLLERRLGASDRRL
ncbi:MAG: amino acid ABC transporter permease [Oscillospiraceae bacterium]|jgi:ABC-type amino acid transport system permease subunit|nr:amino acid ABC transporter permease [Oscillospiraceae bacterium]